MPSSNSHSSSRSGRSSSSQGASVDSRGGAPGNWRLGDQLYSSEEQRSSSSRTSTISSQGGQTTPCSSSQGTIRPSSTHSTRTTATSTHSFLARAAMDPYHHISISSYTSSPASRSSSTSSTVSLSSSTIPPVDVLLGAAWALWKRFDALHFALEIDKADIQDTLSSRGYSSTLVNSVMADAKEITDEADKAVKILMEVDMDRPEWDDKKAEAAVLLQRAEELVEAFEKSQERKGVEREVKKVR